MRRYWTLPKMNNDFNLHAFHCKNLHVSVVSACGAVLRRLCDIGLGSANGHIP
jgi:hypothetical protein